MMQVMEPSGVPVRQLLAELQSRFPEVPLEVVWDIMNQVMVVLLYYSYAHVLVMR